MRFLFVSCSLVLLITACLDKETFSDIPEIGFEDIKPEGTSVIVKISFTDGDGDLGLKDSENFFPYGDCDPFNKNLIVDPYFLQDKVWVSGRYVVESDCPDREYDTLGFDQRIKYLVPDGADKTLQGDIFVTLNDVLLTIPDDTVKFRITLIDRALNHSNEIETPAIITPAF